MFDIFHITTHIRTIELKRLHSDDREELMLRLLLFNNIYEQYRKRLYEIQCNVQYAVTNSYKEFIAL